MRRIFIKPKIQNKLIFSFIFVALLPMILSTYLVVTINSKFTEKEIRERVIKASHQTLRQIAELTEDAALKAKEWAKREEVKETITRWQGSQPLLLSLPVGTRDPVVLWFPQPLEGIDNQDKQNLPLQTVLELDIEKTRTLLAGAILPVEEKGKRGNLIVGYALGKSFTQNIENITGVVVRIWRKQREAEGGESIRGLKLSPGVEKEVFEQRKASYDSKAFFQGEPYQAYCQPLLTFHEKMVGLIFFGIPKRFSFQATVTTWRFFPILIFMGVIMAYLLGYTIARGISKPIRQLAKVAKAVGKGDLSQKILVRSGDEIGALSRSFNSMIERLRQMRSLEEELRRKDRLAALGEMAAGMAHEIRNPLSIIKNSAQIIQSKLGEGNKGAEQVRFIISEVDRLNKVVTDFLNFARPRHPNFKQCNINELIDNTLQFAHSEITGHNIQVIKNYQDNIPLIELDPEQFHQLLLNLTLNAIQSMSKGGKLTITTRWDKSPLGKEKGNGAVQIAFTDTGCGISPEAKDKIFNPFFTTREGGCGLGLAIVHRIVELHGGRITVESEPNEGSTFTIIVPLQIER